MDVNKDIKVNYHIISLFPDSFSSYIESSIIKRAIKERYISINIYNPRDIVNPKGAQKNKEKPLRVIDDKPYGGGPGMLIKAEPIIQTIDLIKEKIKKIQSKNKKNSKPKLKIIFLTPRGKQFTTEIAKEYVNEEYTDIIFICGRYEGIDTRVLEVFKDIESVSVGPWIVTGGELPTLIMIDSISRQIKGVLGKIESLEENRISSDKNYTRPEVFTYKRKKYKVPEILLSGNHKEIDKWRSLN